MSHSQARPRREKGRDHNMDKRFGMTQKARKALCSVFLAGGLFGTQAHAAVTTPTIPDRVAAVRAEMNKRVAEAQQLGGHEAIAKLPYTQMQVASLLN